MTWDPYPSTNAAYNLNTGPRSLGPSASTPFYTALGPAASLDACAAAAASWRNGSSAPCLTAVWLRAPPNATFARTCWCMPQPKWIPVVNAGGDSPRLGLPWA